LDCHGAGLLRFRRLTRINRIDSYRLSGINIGHGSNRSTTKPNSCTVIDIVAIASSIGGADRSRNVSSGDRNDSSLGHRVVIRDLWCQVRWDNRSRINSWSKGRSGNDLGQGVDSLGEVNGAMDGDVLSGRCNRSWSFEARINRYVDRGRNGNSDEDGSWVDAGGIGKTA
jgi:hypothetical protein